MLWNMILIWILHWRLSIKRCGWKKTEKDVWKKSSASVGDDESRAKRIKEGGGSGRGRDRGRQNWKCLRVKQAGETEMGGGQKTGWGDRERELQNKCDATFCLSFTTFSLDLRTHAISTIACHLNLRASIGVPQGCVSGTLKSLAQWWVLSHHQWWNFNAQCLTCYDPASPLISLISLTSPPLHPVKQLAEGVAFPLVIFT